MINSADFGKRLQIIMDHYGISATAFAEKLGINRSTISHLLSGRNKPSLDVVMKVLQAYPEVELYWLLNGTGNFPSTPTSGIPEGKDGCGKDTSLKKRTQISRTPVTMLLFASLAWRLSAPLLPVNVLLCTF